MRYILTPNENFALDKQEVSASSDSMGAVIVNFKYCLALWRRTAV